MSDTPQDYRELAAECQLQANEAQDDPKATETFTRLAEHWTKMAEDDEAWRDRQN